jgi:hypothetical protein
MDVSSSETPELVRWLDAHFWHEAEFVAKSSALIRELDARLLEVLPRNDTVRRAWLERISHYQRPLAGGSRFLWLTPEEAAALSPITTNN